jgi:heme exporter protein B
LSLQLSLLRDMAPGVLWVAALLSSLLSLDALFKSDADDGTLEQLALSGQDLTLIVIAKTAGALAGERRRAGVVSPLVGTALGIPVAAFRHDDAEPGAGHADLELARGDRCGAHRGAEARQRAAVADRAAAGDAAC